MGTCNITGTEMESHYAINMNRTGLQEIIGWLSSAFGKLAKEKSLKKNWKHY